MTDRYKARHLPLADQIVVLDKSGSLTQIGDFQKLNSCEGYVRDLQVQQSSPDATPPSTSKTPSSTSAKSPNPQTKEVSQAKKPVIQGKKSIGTRDKATYRFYFGPIGVLRTLVLAFAVVSLAFATRFQRKCSNFEPYHDCKLTMRYKGSGWNGGPRIKITSRCI